MKKKKEMSSDEKIIFEKISEETPELPESLSPESITALVSGKKQRTPKKGVIKRFVAVSVAACIAICSFVIYDTAVYAPKVDTASDVAYAESYTAISGMLTDYYKSLRLKSHFYMKATNSSNLYAADDTAAYEVVAEAEYDGADNAETADTASEFSQTNLREAGVEEADIVKTDGEYIYASGEKKVYIVKAQDGSLSLCAVIEKERTDFKLKEQDYGEEYYYGEDYYFIDNFYIYNNSLIMVIRKYAHDENGEQMQSGVMIYDISDKTSPVFVREVLFDGWGVSSRIVNGQLIFVSAYTVYEYRFEADNSSTFIPAVYEDEKVRYPAAEDIIIADTAQPNQFLTVAKLSLNGNDTVPQTLTVFGAGSDIYCTQSNLYVFISHYNTANNLINTFVTDTAFKAASSGLTTDIVSVDISSDAPVFKAKGCVKGNLLNTWSLDEYNGYLRLAVTDTASFVYVLDGELKQVGVSEAIAEGEQIKSVRFSGDTAYVVTFFQTDPLFVIDLSDPAKPTVKGELKIPGFSEYLHPVGSGLMLGVGRGGTDSGTDGSAKLSLFDVSDPLNPKEVNSLVFEEAWFETDHRAFVSVGDGTFILPLVRYVSTGTQNGASYYYAYSHINGAVRVGIEDGKIKLVTEYSVPDNRWGNQRAVFIGDTVYTLIMTGAEIAFNSFGLDSGEKLGDFIVE